MDYRREIDGLRALAVVPVILFHAGYAAFEGGFVGVDIFFVISGFLITRILLDDLKTGRYSIAKFYERRIRRIIPAFLAMVIACLPFALLWMFPTQLVEFCKSIIASIIFSSNIFFWYQADYFDTASELKPLLHTWSLSVEEQYYLVFPLLLRAVYSSGTRTLLTILITIAIISFWVAEYGSHNFPEDNFYFLTSRAWELLAGSIIAVVDKEGLWRKIGVLADLGFGLILVSIFFLDSTMPFPGWRALLPVLGAALVIYHCQQGTFSYKILSSRISVGIGLISYSAYLWHFPLLALPKIRSLDELDQLSRIGAIALTFLLAAGTWRFIERPFRTSAHYSINFRKIVVAYLSVSAVLIGLSVYLINDDGAKWRTNGAVTMGELDASVRKNYGLDEACQKQFKTVAACQTSATPQILLWGDSYAMHLAQGIVASEPGVQLQQHTISSCTPILGISNVNTNRTRKSALHCIDFNNRVFEWLGKSQVKVVILASPFEGVVRDRLIDRNGEQIDGKSDEIALDYFRKTIEQLHSLNMKVVIIAPPPRNTQDTGQCAIRAIYFGEDVARCNYTWDREAAPYKFLDRIADDAPIYWLPDVLCDDNHLCHAVDGNTVIFRDTGHISIEASKLLGSRLHWAQTFVEMAK